MLTNSKCFPFTISLIQGPKLPFPYFSNLIVKYLNFLHPQAKWRFDFRNLWYFGANFWPRLFLCATKYWAENQGHWALKASVAVLQSKGKQSSLQNIFKCANLRSALFCNPWFFIGNNDSNNYRMGLKAVTPICGWFIWVTSTLGSWCSLDGGTDVDV